MPSISLRNFGGMAPSANSKSLPEAAATFVQNLDLRFGDFRPLPVPSVIAAATAGASLYKLEGAAGFITRPGAVSFVRGPIPNDATERTYYSGDGAPKVTDLTGDVRQLGVPQPAAAPAIAVNRIAQFSQADAEVARQAKQADYARAIQNSVKRPYVGVSDAAAASFVLVLDTQRHQFRAPGTLVNGNFVPTNPKHRLLMDDRLKFYLGSANGQTFGCVDIAARGMTAAFDGDLDTALATIKNPIDNTTQLLTTDQIAATHEMLNMGLKAREPARDAVVAKIDAMMKEFVTLANNGSDAADASYVDPATVTTQVTSAVTRAVSSIFSAMFTFTNSTGGLPVSVTPGTGGHNYVS
jgi:hypothetical protein